MDGGGWGTRTIAHYEILDVIGKGTYGKVYKGRDKRTLDLVALKKLRIQRKEDGFPRTSVREVRVLTDENLDKTYLVNMREIVTSTAGVEEEKVPYDSDDEEDPDGHRGGTLFMVLEYVPYDLAGLVASQLKMDIASIKCYIFQLLLALDTLHSNGYLHRDLKTANILITDDNRVRLADFGLTRLISKKQRAQALKTGQPPPADPMTPRVVTLWYRAPELLLGNRQYDGAVDMWSVGCIFAELLSGRTLFRAENEMRQLELIFSRLGPPLPGNPIRELPLWKTFHLPAHCRNQMDRYVEDNNIPPDAAAFLRRLLNLDPTARPSAADALKDRFFQTIPVVDRRAPHRMLQPLSRMLDTSLDYHEYTARARRSAAAAVGSKSGGRSGGGGRSEGGGRSGRSGSGGVGGGGDVPAAREVPPPAAPVAAPAVPPAVAQPPPKQEQEMKDEGGQEGEEGDGDSEPEASYAFHSPVAGDLSAPPLPPAKPAAASAPASPPPASAPPAPAREAAAGAGGSQESRMEDVARVVAGSSWGADEESGFVPVAIPGLEVHGGRQETRPRSRSRERRRGEDRRGRDRHGHRSKSRKHSDKEKGHSRRRDHHHRHRERKERKERRSGEQKEEVKEEKVEIPPRESRGGPMPSSGTPLSPIQDRWGQPE